jgi:hypothetical protein
MTTMLHEPGSFVTHAKLPELGSGEVVSSEKGTMRIRFASGERAFLIESVERHLVTTQDAPARPAATKRASKAKAKKKVASS